MKDNHKNGAQIKTIQTIRDLKSRKQNRPLDSPQWHPQWLNIDHCFRHPRLLNNTVLWGHYYTCFVIKICRFQTGWMPEGWMIRRKRRTNGLSARWLWNMNSWRSSENLSPIVGSGSNEISILILAVSFSHT